MNKWIVKDWGFEAEVIDDESKHCRLGLEQGDKFHFAYEPPQDFCSRALTEIFTWCEVIRCGGNFTHRGAKEKYSMEIPCPCHCLPFRLTAIPIRDESGIFCRYPRRHTCGVCECYTLSRAQPGIHCHGLLR